MSNSDSTKKAKRLANALRNMGGPLRKGLQKKLGQAAVAQAALGVRKSRTPYGESFAPLTSRTGTPLRDKGNNIQRSWTSGRATKKSFQFGSRFKWLKTHQYGAEIRPIRAKALAFWVQGASSLGGRGYGKKGSSTMSNLILVQKVIIPRRQMVPERDTGGLGPIWLKSFSSVTRRWVKKVMEGTGGS